MKTITFLCDHCGLSISTPAQNAGRTGKCPNCGQDVVIPASSTFPPPGFTMPEEKSAVAAIVLNLLLFGLGYFYLGLAGGGCACLLVVFLLGIAIAAGMPFAVWVGVVLQVIGICDILIRCDELKKKRKAEMFEKLRRAQMEQMLLQRQWTEMQNLKRCPYCGENIQKSAVLCRFCGSRLDGGEE